MIVRALSTFALVIGIAIPATSQVLGLPVVNNGAPTGITVNAEVGFTNSDGGKGTAVGARASVGIGFLGVTGMISRFAPETGDAVYAPGVAATLRLLGGPLVPFRISAQAGASRWTVNGISTTHVPLSIGLSATIPNPAFAIKPWIAPRLDFVKIGSETDGHFGISGGIDLSLLSGLSFRVAYDRIDVGGAHPGIFGLGVGFTP
jgi:hypothetical protein